MSRNSFRWRARSRSCRAGLFLLAATLLSLTFHVTDAGATPNHAFDQVNGVLSVDYASFLGQFDLVYGPGTPGTGPATTLRDGLPFGTGRVGALISNGFAGSGSLLMELSNVDGSPNGQLPSGNFALDSSTPFSASALTMTLQLFDNLVVLTNSEGTLEVLIFPDTTGQLIGIHVEDQRPGITYNEISFGLWSTAADPSDEYMYVEPWANWATPNANTSVPGCSNCISLGRGGQTGNPFGDWLVASVQGANLITSANWGTSVSMTVSASPSYTVWLANTAQNGDPQGDSLQTAVDLIAAAKNSPWTSTALAGMQKSAAFWQRSFVDYSNPGQAGSYIENLYYVYMYLLAAGASGKNPQHFVSGVLRADQDHPAWGGAYWVNNMRYLLHPMLASNHTDLMKATLVNLYGSPSAVQQQTNWTAQQYNTACPQAIGGACTGLKQAEVVRWDGSTATWAIWANEESPVVTGIWSSGVEIADLMHRYYTHTQDTSFLTTTAYPYLRGLGLSAFQRQDSDDWNYSAYGSGANASMFGLESYQGTNPASLMGALETVVPKILSTLEYVKDPNDANLIGNLQEIQSNLFLSQATKNGLPVIATTLNGNDEVNYRYNWQSPAMEVVWPSWAVGIGDPNQQIAINTYTQRRFKHLTSGWQTDAAVAARLGMGDEALARIEEMVATRQVRANGLHDDGGTNFEGIGVVETTIQDSLMQSRNGVVRVFPALPSAGSGRFTLLAEGGFLVSSEWDSANAEAKYVGVKAQFAGTFTLVSPWGSAPVDVREVYPVATPVQLTTSGEQVSFPASAGAVYVVEQQANPLSNYTFATITGSTPTSAPKSWAAPHTELTGYTGSRIVTLGGPPLIPAVGHIPDAASVLRYTGTWTSDNGAGGSYEDDNRTWTYAVGSMVEAEFMGSGFSIISDQDYNRGKVDIYVDDSLYGTADCYAPSPATQKDIFSAYGLSSGLHKLKIVLRPDRNPSSGGNFFVLDTIEGDPGAIVDDTEITNWDSGMNVRGIWSTCDQGNVEAGAFNDFCTPANVPQHLGNSARYASAGSNTMSFSFWGSQVQLRGDVYAGQTTGTTPVGSAQVCVDGSCSTVAESDWGYNGTSATIFYGPVLPIGLHTITVGVTSGTFLLDNLELF